MEDIVNINLNGYHSNRYGMRISCLNRRLVEGLHQAEIALIMSNDSTTAEIILNKLAQSIVTAKNHEIKRCLDTIINSDNLIIRQRLCIALIQEACRSSYTQRSEFLFEFNQIFQILDIGVPRNHLVNLWGISSLEFFADKVLESDGLDFLFNEPCWPLCREVGLAILEWSQATYDQMRPEVEASLSPPKKAIARVKDTLTRFSPDLVGKITSPKAFDILVDQIVRGLIPPKNEIGHSLSPRIKDDIYYVFKTSKTAVCLLGKDLLNVNYFDKIDPSSNITMYNIFENLSQVKLIFEYIDNSNYSTTFASHYLMDELHELLEEITTDLSNVLSVRLFKCLAEQTYNIMMVEQPTFIKSLETGLAIAKASSVYTSEIFSRLKLSEEIEEHIFLQAQASYIDWILSQNINSHIKMGWPGHFIWGLVKKYENLGENSLKNHLWQIQLINTGEAREYHDQKLSPDGRGHLHALTRTSQLFNTKEMRNYLERATRFQESIIVEKHISQNNLTLNDETIKHLRIASNYDGLGWGGDKIYTKGQRSITCMTKACKGIVHTEDSGRYDQFHLISKMLAFTTYYNRVKNLGHSREFECELRRTVVKRIFFTLEKQGVHARLLQVLVEHFIADKSDPWSSYRMIKTVYHQFVKGGDVLGAKKWLRYIYEKDFDLGLQLSAEVIDVYMDGLCSFDMAADAIELLSQNTSNSDLTFSTFGKRCSRFENFPWTQLYLQRPNLFMNLLHQMSQSERYAGMCKGLRRIVFEGGNLPPCR